MRIFVPSLENIITNNKEICLEGGNPFGVLDKGKIESAIYTAFYPHPDLGDFVIARIAGALCFYLVMAHAFLDGNKRTGALSAIAFMNANGWDLQYQEMENNGLSALANMIQKCAIHEIGKQELMDWFDLHKVNIQKNNRNV